MTVESLIALLMKLDKDSTVVLSSDAEGNNFSPVAGADSRYFYVPDSSWSGALYELDPDETFENFKEEFENAKKAVVLYPVN